jgi:hypothetical protein
MHLIGGISIGEIMGIGMGMVLMGKGEREVVVNNNGPA